MDRSYFDKVMNGVFAAFQKPQPREGVLEEAYKPVADYPEDFIDWAAVKLKEEEKLPLNLGRELKRLYPAWKAETTPVEQWDPYRNEQSGDKNCPECKGTGWFYCYPTDPKLYKPGLSPYAIPCLCNTVVDSWEHPPRKACLEDLRRTGRWTFHRPPDVKNHEPTHLGFSLRQLLDRLHAGVGVQDEPEDPRRKLPEDLQ